MNYHCTVDYKGMDCVMYPRTFDKYGESSIKRICVAPAPIHCLIALGALLKKRKKHIIYIYVTNAKSIPADRSVNDRIITKECWIVTPARFYLLGAIDISIIKRTNLLSYSAGAKRDIPIGRRLMKELVKIIAE